MSDNSNGQFYKGLLFGAVVGAVAGVLLAPEEGNKSRDKLKKRLKAAKNEYGPLLNELSKKVEKVSEDLAPAVTVIRERAEEVKKEVEKKAEPIVKEAEAEVRKVSQKVEEEVKKVKNVVSIPTPESKLKSASKSPKRRTPRFFKGV